MSTSRSEVLGLAARAVTVERQATHGDAAQGFGLIAAYWSAHLDHPVNSTDVAAILGLLKLARAFTRPMSGQT
jgi:hypothetical protein